MTKLANEMNVRLHPTKSLEITPEFRGASSAPWFFSGYKVHFRGRVRIGCTILCGLDDLALKGILAHELAHLRKRHSVKGLPSLLLFVPVLVYWIVSKSTPIIPILLTFAIGTLVFSLVSWHHEYEADAVAAEYVGKEYVGKKDMAYALEQVARLMYRPGDTLAHPSFKKRISRLLSEEEQIL
jgi:Zn-dependent protease with chaperone function